jgi:hypothetical protein
MKGSYARKIAPEEYLNNFERTEIDEYDEVWFLAN